MIITETYSIRAGSVGGAAMHSHNLPNIWMFINLTNLNIDFVDGNLGLTSS